MSHMETIAALQLRLAEDKIKINALKLEIAELQLEIENLYNEIQKATEAQEAIQVA